MPDSSRLCFIVMPFDSAFDDIFEHAIERAVTTHGYRCHRADRTAGAFNLIQAMIHHIFEADLVIADLSGGNMNVFYELGVAHSCCSRNKTIMIAEETSEIPFNVSPYNVVLYDRTYSGIQTLRNKISEQIDSLAVVDGPATNPVQEYLTSRDRKQTLEFLPPPSADPKKSVGTYQRMTHALLQLGLLSFLDAWPKDQPAPTLTEICRRLDIRSRKSAFEAIQELSAEGLIERAKGEGALWQLSERGKEMLVRLRPVAKIRIETEVEELLR